MFDRQVFLRWGQKKTKKQKAKKILFQMKKFKFSTKKKIGVKSRDTTSNQND